MEEEEEEEQALKGLQRKKLEADGAGSGGICPLEAPVAYTAYEGQVSVSNKCY